MSQYRNGLSMTVTAQTTTRPQQRVRSKQLSFIVNLIVCSMERPMVTVYAAPIYVTSAMYQHVSVVVQLLRPAQFVFLSCKTI